MKKAMILLVLVLVSAPLFAESGLFGGFYHVGFNVTYMSQDAINQKLSASGYSGLSDLGMGMIWGGGGIINNIFIGGWGSFDYGGSSAINSNASKTISTDVGGQGGIQLGYVVLNTESIMLIPSANLIWGGRGYYFHTNVDFDTYIQNPSTFEPSFYLNYMSVGASLDTIYKFNRHFGLMFRVMYLYTLNSKLGSATFYNAPTVGSHNISASLGFMFGGIDDIQDRRQQKACPKESIPNHSDPTVEKGQEQGNHSH